MPLLSIPLCFCSYNDSILSKLSSSDVWIGCPLHSVPEYNWNDYTRNGKDSSVYLEKEFPNLFILMVVRAYQNLDGLTGFFHADVLKLAINPLAYVVCYFK